MTIFCRFSPKNMFPKNSAKYNCSDPPAFNCRRYRVDWLSNQKLFHLYQHKKSFNQSAQFIKSFVKYTWFKSPMIYKAPHIFYHAHPIIIKVTFSFPKFVATCKNLAHFMDSIFSILDHHHPKITKGTFCFPEFASTHQESVCSINFFLRYCQFHNCDTRVVTPIFDHAYPNILQSTFNFYESVSTCKKSDFFINSC